MVCLLHADADLSRRTVQTYSYVGPATQAEVFGYMASAYIPLCNYSLFAGLLRCCYCGSLTCSVCFRDNLPTPRILAGLTTVLHGTTSPTRVSEETSRLTMLWFDTWVLAMLFLSCLGDVGSCCSEHFEMSQCILGHVPKVHLECVRSPSQLLLDVMGTRAPNVHDTRCSYS
jgi:hypothetical protein